MQCSVNYVPAAQLLGYERKYLDMAACLAQHIGLLDGYLSSQFLFSQSRLGRRGVESGIQPDLGSIGPILQRRLPSLASFSPARSGRGRVDRFALRVIRIRIERIHA